jgi:hypothetical protein
MRNCKFVTMINQGQTLGMAKADSERCAEFVQKCPQA